MYTITQYLCTQLHTKAIKPVLNTITTINAPKHNTNKGLKIGTLKQKHDVYGVFTEMDY